MQPIEPEEPESSKEPVEHDEQVKPKEGNMNSMTKRTKGQGNKSQKHPLDGGTIKKDRINTIDDKTRQPYLPRNRALLVVVFSRQKRSSFLVLGSHLHAQYTENCSHHAKKNYLIHTSCTPKNIYRFILKWNNF